MNGVACSRRVRRFRFVFLFFLFFVGFNDGEDRVVTIDTNGFTFSIAQWSKRLL